jgi:hypothetical protein
VSALHSPLCAVLTWSMKARCSSALISKSQRYDSSSTIFADRQRNMLATGRLLMLPLPAPTLQLTVRSGELSLRDKISSSRPWMSLHRIISPRQT